MKFKVQGKQKLVRKEQKNSSIVIQNGITESMKEKQVHFAGASFCVCNQSIGNTEGMTDDRFFCKYNSMHCRYRKKIFYTTVCRVTKIWTHVIFSITLYNFYS